MIYQSWRYAGFGHTRAFARLAPILCPVKLVTIRWIHVYQDSVSDRQIAVRLQSRLTPQTSASFLTSFLRPMAETL